ncbi:MAG: tRNA pseudouridine(55) synthase TruB [Pseudomonadota bacterium]
MAAKRRGRPVHGWLIVDKPIGITSTAVVNKARWAFQAQKAGHAGTLDPLATGLLAIAFGEATKTVPIAQEGLKTYRFTVRLGQRTSTDDAEGIVISESVARPTDEQIVAALRTFEGDIEQIPPEFSAVKVDGARAYDLARGGADLDLAPRPIWVERIKFVERVDADHAVIEMTCGKGGYVRSIARDLGEALGCHAHVYSLRRLASGNFELTGAIAFDCLDAIGIRGAVVQLLPVQFGLFGLPEVPVPAAAAAKLQNGNPAAVSSLGLGYGDTAWASFEGVPVALVTYRGGTIHPERVFVGLG